MQAVKVQVKDGYVELTQEAHSGGPKLSTIQVDLAQWRQLIEDVDLLLLEKAAKDALSEFQSF